MYSNITLTAELNRAELRDSDHATGSATLRLKLEHAIYHKALQNNLRYSDQT